jgi:hypothetical protein
MRTEPARPLRRLLTRGALLMSLLLVPDPAAAAQQPSMDLPPVRIGMSIPVSKGSFQRAGRPPMTGNQYVRHALYGALGGFAAGTAVMLPIALRGWDGNETPEALIIGLTVAAYVGGTTYGIHWAGRRDGTTANPWATAGGVLAGATVAGAIIGAAAAAAGEEGDPGAAGLLILVAPPLGGTAGYAATRRWR